MRINISTNCTKAAITIIKETYSEIVISKKRISVEAFLMANKPTFEELEQRVEALEKEAAKLRHTKRGGQA